MRRGRRLVLVLALSLGACSGGEGGGGDGGGEATCALPLTCPADLEVTCAGPETPVALGEAIGCPDVDAEGDAPSAYPLGETVVTFRDDAREESCATTVTVIDPTPPLLQCPEALELVSPDGAPVVLAEDIAVAADTCSAAAPTAAPDSESVPVGTSEVVFTATDDAGNSASCTVTVTVQDGAAPTGLQVLGASLSEEDGTAVALGWAPSSSAAVDAVRIERAPAEDGPWTALELSGGVMADGLLVEGDASWFRLVSMVGEEDGGATAPIQVHAIQADVYHVRDVAVSGIPFDTDLYGVVRAPADLSAGGMPLVLLLHGNHGNCRYVGTGLDYCATLEGHDCDYSGYEAAPNAEGMAFQAETLAAQGYVAVSLSGNAVNCRDDYILERAALILGHLAQWRTWVDEPGGEWEGVVDLSRVGLVGHSRGGEAVAHVPGLLADDPIDGVSVGSVFSIAPVDFHDPRIEDTPSLVVVPACDGDVSTLSGREIYDRTVAVVDGQLHAQAFVMGANHNFFSTEWSFNDGQYACPAGDQLSARAQQGWLEATLGPWFDATLRGAGALRSDILAESPTPERVTDWAASALDIRWSHAAASRTRIDDFVGGGAPDRNDLGEANRYVALSSVRQCEEGGCGSGFDHSRSAVEVVWSGASAGSATFGLGGLDASGARALSMRVASPDHAANAGRATHDALTVVVTDSSGASASMRLGELVPVPHLYTAIDTRWMLQTVRVPLDVLLQAEPALDLSALDALAVQLDDGADGALLITDIELAD